MHWVVIKTKKTTKMKKNKYVNPLPGSQQAKGGAEDSEGESGEETAGGAESGGSLHSFNIFQLFSLLSLFYNTEQLHWRHYSPLFKGISIVFFLNQ